MARAVSVLALLMGATAVHAQEWNPIDARTKGMGNAGVAIAEGAAAGYWNPANLAKENQGEPFSFISGGFGGSGSAFTDIEVSGETIATLDKIADIYQGLNFLQAQTDLNASGGADDAALQTAIKVLDALADLQEGGEGIYGSLGGSVELRFGSFNLFHRMLGNGGVNPIVDFGSGINLSSLGIAGGAAGFYGQISGGVLSPAGSNLAAALVAGGFPAAQDSDGDGTPDVEELAFNAQQSLGDQAISDPAFQQLLLASALASQNASAGGDTLFFNNSGAEFRGILMRETGVGVGIPLSVLPIPFLSTINVGIALKEVIGETYYARVTMKNIEDGDDLYQETLRQFSENRTRSNKFSMDLGVSWSPIPWLTAGISARNVVPMKFDWDGPGGEFEVKPQVRGGVGVSLPGGLVKIGLDMDLLEIDLSDYVDDLDVRQLALGAELNLGILKLRSGFFDNIANSETGTVYAGGIGLSLFGWLTVDLNGQIALAKTKIEVSDPNGGTSTLQVPERVSLSASVGVNLGF